jgi:signal transduction histidine kinase
MTSRILTLAIETELDVVAARQRARQIAALCGFQAQDQTRIATAVSELARNVFNYARRGKIEFALDAAGLPQALLIRIDDDGPGIAQLDLVLSGRYQSQTGMGLGIIGARRLMDQCTIDSAPGRGTHIQLKKLLPAGAPVLTMRRIGAIGTELAALPADIMLAEVRQQNRELLSVLAELKARQDELAQLTRELEDTNRGVVALYAELDEKAAHLRRADEMKSRFLSNMSHEFRTPLSSIRALAKLLLDRIDGELTAEQEKQVRFILQGAESLSELVNDLLDLAKIESGKIDLRLTVFSISDLFRALRGMLRPLLTSDAVRLVFEMPIDMVNIYSDEAKLSQILRNFISNALKFTEAGEVMVSAAVLPDAQVKFSVRDTGLGIAPEHQEVIFEEFSQVENRLQGKVKGTGLGLPLCRKLATVLQGHIELESTPGQGSTFSVILPAVFAESGSSGGIEARTADDLPQAGADMATAGHTGNQITNAVKDDVR